MSIPETKSIFNSRLFHNTIKIVLCLGLLAYVIARASELSFTHDESTSFKIVQNQPVWDTTANNHWLNTGLMRVSSSMFGNGEMALRLPNILAFLLYALGAYLISRTINNKWLSLLGMVAILCNPYVLEFFGLARGYGLSLGFLVMSMYFMFRNSEGKQITRTLITDFALSSLFAALSIAASLTLINYYIALLLLFVYRYLRSQKSAGLHLKFWSVLLVALVPLIIGANHLLGLKSRQELYFGAPDFLKGYDALLRCSIAPSPFTLQGSTILQITTLILLLVGVAMVIFRRKFSGRLFYSTILIILLLSGFFFEGIFFGANYPNRRTSLFYIPILAVFITNLIGEVVQNNIKWQKVQSVFLVASSLIILLNLGFSMNTTYASDWSYDANTKKIMKSVQERSASIQEPLTISNHWSFEPTINYYIQLWNLNVAPANRDAINLNADFIYRLQDSTELEGFELDQSYFYGGEFWVNDKTPSR
ncbi:MAG: glycosyltransferase family 39 protein [Flavobacteriales bacterium]|nr:glycosyltransferase family 39 protein [Flavobacteriales bacterium]